MVEKNKELKNKLIDAFKKAGVDLAPQKTSASSSRGQDKTQANKKIVKNSEKSTGRAGKNKRSRSRGRGPISTKSQTQISTASIKSAYYPAERTKDAHPAKIPVNEKSSLKALAGVQFAVNPVFSQRESFAGLLIDETRCQTQLNQGSTNVVQLVVGLDLGSSATKVVIGSPDQKRFFAVPFCSNELKSPYMVPTGIKISESGNIVAGDDGSEEIRRDIKTNLMTSDDDASILDVAGFIAQVIRFSLNWFLNAHAAEYSDFEIFWNLSIGLPADSARQSELSERFRTAGLVGAQIAISALPVSIDHLSKFLVSVRKDLRKISETNSDSVFPELGADENVVVVVPEIAAQVVGYYRSRRWDPKRPISLLIDVGATTLDVAVFSLVDPQLEEKELAFCAFSCNVEEQGSARLHRERVAWLTKNLPDDITNKDQVLEFLIWTGKHGAHGMAVPESLNDYLNNVQLIGAGRTDDPDQKFESELHKTVYERALTSAIRKSPTDSAWNGLRTMLCGGGARCKLYRNYLTRLNSRQKKIRLDDEPMEKPDNLIAPKLQEVHYDRISVAYGLAQGTQWELRWPEEIEDIVVARPTARGKDFITKDQV